MKISNLSESEFLSFIYAERDREYSLNQFHGWNNWALIVIFITVICTIYTVLKENNSVNWKEIVYFSDGIIAYFFLYHSWWRFLKPKRGVDFSKLRMLKEVIPNVKISFLFLYAIISSVLILKMDGLNNIFWWWIILIASLIIIVVVIFLFRKKLVPSYFEELLLPWIWADLFVVVLYSMILAIIGQKTFKMTTTGIYSPEFVISICLSICFVLLYILIKINISNKPMRRIDAIIDRYLYTNITKEDVYREIMINRMGYGVLDACSKDLTEINELREQHSKDDLEMDSMIKEVENGHSSFEEMNSYATRMNEILNNQMYIFQLSKKLNDRINEILTIAPHLNNVPEVRLINDTCSMNFSEIKRTTSKMKQMVEKMKSFLDETKKDMCELKTK